MVNLLNIGISVNLPVHGFVDAVGPDFIDLNDPSELSSIAEPFFRYLRAHLIQVYLRLRVIVRNSYFQDKFMEKII